MIRFTFTQPDYKIFVDSLLTLYKSSCNNIKKELLSKNKYFQITNIQEKIELKR